MDDRQPLPTMQELRDQSRKARGLVCRKCGCRRFRTETTRPGVNVIIRYKRCLNCGTRRTSYET